MKKKAMVKEMDLFAPADFGEKSSDVLVEKASDDFGEISSKGDVSEREMEVAALRANDIATLFVRLSQSKFRSSFYLNQKDKAIIGEKGLPTIREHARQIIAKRLAPAFIPNDGKQTPMRHGASPVFIAQHATGCCCRGCLEKWHHIPKGRALTADEQAYVVDVLMHWIIRKCE